jgi:GINS complex subunit 2
MAASLGVVSSSSSSMSPYQWHGFASHEVEVQIIPKFTMERLDFISKPYGPFYPNYPVNVPLWLALYLRETNSCTITPPYELTVAFLQEKLAEEQRSNEGLNAVSPQFFDVARQLLRFAPTDIPDAAEVHRLVDELEHCRELKISRSVGYLNEQNFPPEALFFSAFATSEVEMLRATLLPALNDGVLLQNLARERVQPAAPPRAVTTVSRPTGSSVEAPSLSGRQVARQLEGSYPTDLSQMPDETYRPGAATIITENDTTATSDVPAVKKRRTLRPR